LNILVFDIETIPDVELGRKLLELDAEVEDKEAGEAMFAARREKTGGSDFLALHQHRVAAISGVFRGKDTLRIQSFGDPSDGEAEIIRRFFGFIEKFTPMLVSWNGGAFDLPVLHYRALRHGIASPTYWDTGEQDQGFKWNNYLSRYHQRHTDLMDTLSAYQPRAVAPLDEVAQMLGLPGKMGMHGGKVWEAFQSGEIEAIRNYCETDVLNTYLVFLRFELIRGHLSEDGYLRECSIVKDRIRDEGRPHLLAYLEAWERME